MNHLLIQWGWTHFFDGHETLLRLLILALIFGFGVFEAFVLESKEVACFSWFWGLTLAAIWIAYPLTFLRLSLGVVAFGFGIFAIVYFYQSSKKSGTAP